jgi:O-antigen/teichoic acid export membrane protein
MAKNLKKKAASSMFWMAIQKYSTMFIQFISGIVLARLLTPYDYGCIGMLSIFMVLAETFIDGGFGSALIQKKRPTQEDYSTIFFWNLFMAVILYAVLFACAPAIARFYKTPLLSKVLRVQGVILFIYAFNMVQRNQLRKNLNFKVLSIITLASSAIALGVTIVMAYKGFGVWALVVQHILIAAIPAIAFWFFVKWRPILAFSWKSFKELFSFGFYMFLIHLINQFSTQLQGLLIGRFYNATTMGYYSKALKTESLASHSVSSVMTQVTFPLYAEMQDNKQALAGIIKRITMTLSYFSFPLLFILLLVAKPLFVILYSERWLPSVPYFQVLCIAGLASCLQAVNLQSISAIGKSKTNFIWTIVKRTIGIGAVILGLVFFGMKGLLAGVVFNFWFSYLVNISLVSKYIGYKWYQQIKDLLPVGIVSFVIAAICYLVGNLLHLGMYADGAVKLIIYLVLYFGWSIFFKPEAYTYFLTVIPKKVRFWERKKRVNNTK